MPNPQDLLPSRRVGAALVALLGLGIGLCGRPTGAAAQVLPVPHGGHEHPPAMTVSPRTLHAVAPAPAPASTAPAAPAQIPVPAAGSPSAATPLAPSEDPLVTPARMVEHPDHMPMESVAVAGRRLIAGGLNGVIILSDDNGATWHQVGLPVSTTITGISFTSDTTGWAIGHSGAVLHTLDGGEHWTLVYDGMRAAQATLAAARAANAADSVRSRKIDAAQKLIARDKSRPFLLVQAASTGITRLVGSDNLSVETDDGGRNWRPWSDAIDNPDGLPTYGIAQLHGITVIDGERGLLLAGRPEDGLRALKSPFDGTWFGVIDGGAQGVVIFGQQGHVYSADLAGDWQPGHELAWRRIIDPSTNTLTAGLQRQDGSVLLADTSGATWWIHGKPEDARLVAGPVGATFPILAMVEAMDRSLILAGPGGVVRIPAPPAPAPASP
ncbi:WD40/YVTN/BNR-like repeat-containing protein [Lichenicola sp.]|uniref:WD40/YVTN/BNR-like repeat-containing protein n=1 Tax=Lichenicola sp. TaxID=2804529 RepID=UPI003B007BF3